MAPTTPKESVGGPVQTKQDVNTNASKIGDSDYERTCNAQNPLEANESVEIIVVPRGKEVAWLRGLPTRNISVLAAQSKRAQRIPANTDENIRRFKSARLHLAWLYTNLQMTPKIRDGAPIQRALELILTEPGTHFPPDIVEKARALQDKWESENWGADEVVDGQGEYENEENESPQEETNFATQDLPTHQITLPSRDDPLYGPNGLMAGVLCTRSAKTGIKVYTLNPEVEKPSARVFGHNGLTVGRFFAKQIAALAASAHGSRVGGIYGNLSEGAYSIVSSQLYHDLDRDEGNVLYYSGSNSHSNDNPLAPAASSSGTKALKISLMTRKPVRVLRSGGSVGSKNSNPYAPSSGIRYDGLYEVVRKLTPKNARGGMYEQFELRRCPGQVPLADIVRAIPTREQLEALERL